jgi:hypothetical protein
MTDPLFFLFLLAIQDKKVFYLVRVKSVNIQREREREKEKCKTFTIVY